MTCYIQDWIKASAALLTPTIAIFGAWLAYKQHHISRDKLRLDLYDRRYKVYFCMASCLEQAVREGTATNDLLIKYNVGTRDVLFLFDNSIVELEKEIREKLINLKFHDSKSKHTSGKKQSEHIDKTEAALDLITVETLNLQLKMAPWLSFSNLR
jgi:hypothetical protein